MNRREFITALLGTPVIAKLAFSAPAIPSVEPYLAEQLFTTSAKAYFSPHARFVLGLPGLDHAVEFKPYHGTNVGVYWATDPLITKELDAYCDQINEEGRMPVVGIDNLREAIRLVHG